MWQDGVPCAPPAPVASLSTSAERPGTVTVPPLDVDRVRHFNPATLSKGGTMWYAVNPVYSIAEVSTASSDALPSLLFRSTLTPSHAPNRSCSGGAPCTP